MRAARNIVGLMLALAVSGCALAMNGTPPQTYDLVAPEVASVRGQPLPVQLVVRTPTAVRALDTERILVRPASERISYYPASAWSDRLPRLVRARLTEALEDSGHFRAVVTEDDRVTSNYSLQIAIRAFEMSVNGKPPEGHVALSAKIVDERAGEVVASRRFESRVRAKSDAVGEGVAAITSAFHDVSRDLIRWLTNGSQRSRLGAGS
jgi:cholesterol transport system auxiliary component